MLLAHEDARPDGSFNSPSRQVVGRAAICSTVALIEGTAATVTVFAVAAAYHLLILKATYAEFGWGFYATFGIITGAAYAMFSAVACSRFLDNEQRKQDAISICLIAWTAAVALTLLTAFLVGKVGDVSRVTLTVAYGVGIVLLPALRRFIWAQVARRISSGRLRFERIAVIGRKADVTNFLINGELWRRGHVLTGTFYVDDTGTALDEKAVTDFVRDNVRGGANHLVVLGDLSDMDGLERFIESIKRFALNVVYAPATQNRRLKFIDVVAIGPNNALRFLQKPMSDGAVLIKRAFDLLLAGVGIVLLAPLFAIVAVAIKATSPGPVFYRQERRGFNGEIFLIWKFRTMSVTESGYAITQATAGDKRVTRIGRLLRATSIDELPQLINVLAGQMSLVGPRPHAVSHDDDLSRQLETYAHRQRIKPGITGWAQVNGFRGETATLDQIEGRVVHDIYYIENWSVLMDLWVLMLTVLSPVTHRNVF